MQHISPRELKEKLARNEPLVLIDVREPHEWDQFNIGGMLIPLAEVIQRVEAFTADIPVVVCCKKGVRSQIAIQKLQQKYSLPNLFNLAGGLDAWRRLP